MKSLKEMEGELIVLRLALVGDDFMQVRLHKVEDFGIWIETQVMTDMLLSSVGAPASQKTPVFFLPWNAVLAIVGWEPGTSLNRAAFGV